MIERRSERRLMCSDLVAIQFEQGRAVAAVLFASQTFSRNRRPPLPTGNGRLWTLGVESASSDSLNRSIAEHGAKLVDWWQAVNTAPVNKERRRRAQL